MKIKKSLKIVFLFTLINLTEALEWQNELVSVILPNGNSCLCSSYATATSGIIEALTLACKQVSLLAQQVDDNESGNLGSNLNVILTKPYHVFWFFKDQNMEKEK